jgi:hypothetical protein
MCSRKARTADDGCVNLGHLVPGNDSSRYRDLLFFFFVAFGAFVFFAPRFPHFDSFSACSLFVFFPPLAPMQRGQIMRVSG